MPSLFPCKGKTHVIRQLQSIILKIYLRYKDVLRNPSRNNFRVFPCFTLYIITPFAIPACEARCMMMAKNSVSGFERFNLIADFNNLARRLMAENKRRLLFYIPWHHISRAYAGSPRFYHGILRPCLRNRHVLNPYVVESIKFSDFHLAVQATLLSQIC